MTTVTPPSSHPAIWYTADFPAPVGEHHEGVAPADDGVDRLGLPGAAGRPIRTPRGRCGWTVREWRERSRGPRSWGGPQHTPDLRHRTGGCEGGRGVVCARRPPGTRPMASCRSRRLRRGGREDARLGRDRAARAGPADGRAERGCHDGIAGASAAAMSEGMPGFPHALRRHRDGPRGGDRDALAPGESRRARDGPPRAVIRRDRSRCGIPDRCTASRAARGGVAHAVPSRGHPRRRPAADRR